MESMRVKSKSGKDVYILALSANENLNNGLAIDGEPAENMGMCIACGEFCDNVEPDARRYECYFCGRPKVFGLEELFLIGYATVTA